MNADDAARFEPQVELPPVDGRLATSVARLPRRRIQAIEYEGEKLWLKRALPAPAIEWRAALREWLSRRAWPGVRWLPRVEWGSAPLLREARRLVHLRAAGIEVPEVLGATSHWMVLVDAGKSMQSVLRMLGARNRAWLLSGAAADLAKLHAAGFWHGGAQVKNTTILDGRRVRIDFDDGFDDALTLADLQARDLFCFLHSCVDWVPADALVALVGAYLDAGGAQDTVSLARTEMSPLNGWPALRHLPSGGLRRLLGASAALGDASA